MAYGGIVGQSFDDSVIKEYIDQQINELKQQISETSVKIATGSYVGTGTYGASNKNNVYVGFYPKLFVIYGTNSDIDFWFFRCGAMSETDQPNMYGRVGSGTSHDLDPNHARYVPDNGGGIRWWNENSADGQLNNSNITYYYTALG